jgi:hypothetical protein
MMTPFVRRPTPANFLRLIDRLQRIREMQIPEDGAWRVQSEPASAPRPGGRQIWSICRTCAACTRSTGSTVPTLLKALDFKGAPSSQPLLKAIDLLCTLDESGKRKVPANAPRGFVRRKRQPHVIPPDGGIDRCYYELCVLTELRNGLRSGDVWVEGSPRYADFEGYLNPPAKRRRSLR